MPVSLAADSPGTVSGNSISKPSGKCKAYPVVGQFVLQYKELRAPAAKPLAPAENLPNFVPSL
jgi:hypothetical protein